MTKGNLGKIETETWYNLESYIDYGNVQSFFVTKEQPVQYYTSLWSKNILCELMQKILYMDFEFPAKIIKIAYYTLHRRKIHVPIRFG